MSQRSDKIIVEMFGLPGVGKTTFSRKLATDFGYIHITTSGVSNGEYIFLTFRYPKVVAVWMLLIFKNLNHKKSIRHFRYNVSLLYSTLLKIHLAHQCSGKSVVIDEGLVQRFLSYSDVILNENDIKRALKVSPLGDVIIYLNHRIPEKDRFDEGHDRASLGTEYLAVWRSNVSSNIHIVSGALKSLTTKKYFETKDTQFDDIIKNINSATS